MLIQMPCSKRHSGLRRSDIIFNLFPGNNNGTYLNKGIIEHHEVHEGHEDALDIQSIRASCPSWASWWFFLDGRLVS